MSTRNLPETILISKIVWIGNIATSKAVLSFTLVKRSIMHGSVLLNPIPRFMLFLGESLFFMHHFDLYGSEWQCQSTVPKFFGTTDSFAADWLIGWCSIYGAQNCWTFTNVSVVVLCWKEWKKFLKIPQFHSPARSDFDTFGVQSYSLTIWYIAALDWACCWTARHLSWITIRVEETGDHGGSKWIKAVLWLRRAMRIN